MPMPRIVRPDDFPEAAEEAREAENRLADILARFSGRPCRYCGEWSLEGRACDPCAAQVESIERSR